LWSKINKNEDINDDELNKKKDLNDDELNKKDLNDNDINNLKYLLHNYNNYNILHYFPFKNFKFPLISYIKILNYENIREKFMLLDYKTINRFNITISHLQDNEKNPLAGVSLLNFKIIKRIFRDRFFYTYNNIIKQNGGKNNRRGNKSNGNNSKGNKKKTSSSNTKSSSSKDNNSSSSKSSSLKGKKEDIPPKDNSSLKEKEVNLKSIPSKDNSSSNNISREQHYKNMCSKTMFKMKNEEMKNDLMFVLPINIFLGNSSMYIKSEDEDEISDENKIKSSSNYEDYEDEDEISDENKIKSSSNYEDDEDEIFDENKIKSSSNYEDEDQNFTFKNFICVYNNYNNKENIDFRKILRNLVKFYIKNDFKINFKYKIEDSQKNSNVILEFIEFFLILDTEHLEKLIMTNEFKIIYNNVFEYIVMTEILDFKIKIKIIKDLLLKERISFLNTDNILYLSHQFFKINKKDKEIKKEQKESILIELFNKIGLYNISKLFIKNEKSKNQNYNKYYSIWT
jgi:hypothetical protein